MKGYFKVNLSAEASELSKSSSKRTGEQRLALVEKALRKDGVAFVEDFEADSVIVRYGDFINDAAWDAHCRKSKVKTEELEPACV
jgi:hypothetical protein